MENHSAQNIIGNPAAPYINSLATSGASMTQSFAITHPSQPNYIALFSGALNGVVDNTCPNTLTADNLGSQLIGAGLSFVGYSESLPSAGFTGCTSGPYARKHNPWVNFTNVPAAVESTVDQPADGLRDPADGVDRGAEPEQRHARRHHRAGRHLAARPTSTVTCSGPSSTTACSSLTWDEDDNNAGNRIPTIFAGAGVRTGQYPEHIDHYSVLRTLQDMYGLPPLANSATASPIVDIWDTAPGQPGAGAGLHRIVLATGVLGRRDRLDRSGRIDRLATPGTGVTAPRAPGRPPATPSPPAARRPSRCW